MDYQQITIDRGSDVAIAEQVSGQLLRAILDGQIQAGARLMPERDLADLLAISRGTVKRAYAKLLQLGAIEMRQGSGSYVLKRSPHFAQYQKKEATAVIAATFSKLRDTGLTDKEIFNLINLHYLNIAGGSAVKKISIMVVSNNHDILSELEQQFSYLTDSSPFLFTLSFITLDTIVGNSDPVQILLAYDLVIATTIDYAAIRQIAPMLSTRILEARISPRTKTLAELSLLPTNARVSIVYRTEVFREMVRRCLLSFGFHADNIFCYTDQSYHPVSHADNGVVAVINYNQSPVLVNPAFAQRNKIFTDQGGQILRFGYQIERNSLIYIEDRLQQLLQHKE